MRPLAAPTYSPEEMIAFAREHCPFYRRLYADAPAGARLDQVPVIDQEEFWQAHGRNRREVLTGPLHDGFVLNSGGTTGAAKFSYYAGGEWEVGVKLSAVSFEEAGLQDGDRVATLFASGNLYASQLFATASLEQARPKVMQFPLGYSMAFADAAAVIQSFQINVLVGVPTHIIKLIDHLDVGSSAASINRIIYAGELFSSEQHQFLKTSFPGVRVHSAGYASVDAGLIAYAEANCEPGEHRVYDSHTVMDIVDEQTGLPITDTGIPGKILYTSLFRRLMPFIRYPTGDRGQWIGDVEQKDRKFQLLGRSEEAARAGRCMVWVSEIARLLEPFRAESRIGQYQLLVTREEMYDRLIVRAVADPSASLKDVGEEITSRFLDSRPDYVDSLRRGILHPPRVEWINADQLIVSERTGKMLRVVDRRNG